MSVLSGLRLAIGTLTIVPVGSIDPLPPRAPRAAMSLAPVAVLPVAVLAGLVTWLGSIAGLPPIVTAALTLASIAWSTRAMHLDGFADTIDGFGGGWTRERALEIMRRGDVGPMGVAGLILLLLVQAGVLAQLTLLPWAGLLVGAAVCVSRLAATVMCSTPMPPARDSGMGAVVARSVPPGLVLTVAVLSAAVLALCVTASGVAFWWGPIAIGALLVVVSGFAFAGYRRFGGVTGDLMGAAIEIGFTVVLLTLAIAV